jgi:DNA-binding transcriptional regulator YbjK
MTGRRADILDGALAVLAGTGMRGLTHRAVDAAAGLAVGSTSYYFRSRDALVAGCVERLLERDLADDVPEVEDAVRSAPDPARALADVLTAVGVRMATTERTRTLARYELSLAAVRDPALRAVLVRGGDTIRRRGAALLAGAGAVDPDGAAAELAAVLDGLVYTALVRGPAGPEALAAWLRPVLHRAARAVPGIAPPDEGRAGPPDDRVDRPGGVGTRTGHRGP